MNEPKAQNQPGTYDLELAHRFKFHPPDSQGKADAHAMVRAECQRLAEFVETVVPAGRECSLAITKIEECMMWSNAGLARARA